MELSGIFSTVRKEKEPSYIGSKSFVGERAITSIHILHQMAVVKLNGVGNWNMSTRWITVMLTIVMSTSYTAGKCNGDKESKN